MDDRETLLDEIRDLAKAGSEADRIAAVIELLHVYLQFRPGDGFMWYTLGDALRRVGLTDEAEHALNAALTNCPDKRSQILVQLGRLYDAVGRRGEAEAAFGESCRDAEMSGFGWLWITRGANLSSDTQLAAAEKCYRQALTLDGSRVDRDEAYLNLGYVLRAQGRYREAVEAFRSALAITPNYPEAREGLASLEGIEGALAKAQALSKYGMPDVSSGGDPP